MNLEVLKVAVDVLVLEIKEKELNQFVKSITKKIILQTSIRLVAW